jgi:leucyl aminopeptidase
MLSPVTTPPLALTTAPPAEAEVDLLSLPLFEDDDVAGELRAVDQATGGAIGRALASQEMQGKPFESFVTPVLGGWRAARIQLIGGGRRDALSTERLRKMATAAALVARQRRVARIGWLERGGLNATASVQAVAEGLVLASFSGDRLKTGERMGPPPEQMTIIAAGHASGASLEAAAERGRILGESSNLSRGLCNEPGNLLTPAIFAERARDICVPAGVTVEILGETEIAQLGMGLLLGVARGSAEPPRLIVLRHDPPGAPDAPVLGLVGKGITFDTGGISIKPAEGMERMKDDMSGGAAVIGALRAIALLRAPIRVIGIVPSTENMPGGRAMKPGDVLTAASGKTVEIINTDAEGRLVLGDGLWYAQKLGATHLVDVATLTGACVVALGRAASAIFGQPDRWVNVVRRTGERAGDRLWPMPLYEEYGEQMRSDVADIINSGGRPAGVCTAAAFLKEFAGALPWAHLDIAGTAWAEEAKPWQPKGATGVAVRTLAELAFTSDEWT